MIGEANYGCHEDERHSADYDLAKRFLRSDVNSLINQAERTVGQFDQLSDSGVKRFFLVCLLAWDNMSKR